jgi:biopolymer transport protein ExbD
MTSVPEDATEQAVVAQPAGIAASGVGTTSETGEAPTGEFALTAGDAPPNPWADEEHEEEHVFQVRKGAAVRDDLDMTSLVDICFLLLVFFMITASFHVQKSLQVASPEADDSAASAAPVVTLEDITGESVVVEIDEQDRIKIDENAVNGMQQLKDVLISKRQTEQKTDVLIEHAYKSTHGTVVEVTAAAMEIGMQKVRRMCRNSDD